MFFGNKGHENLFCNPKRLGKSVSMWLLKHNACLREFLEFLEIYCVVCEVLLYRVSQKKSHSSAQHGAVAHEEAAGIAWKVHKSCLPAPSEPHPIPPPPSRHTLIPFRAILTASS